MRVLVTGAAGFIGFHVVGRLVERDEDVVGLDNLSEYYDIRLKHGRLDEAGIPVERIRDGVLIPSGKHPRYRFVKMDLRDGEAISGLFEREKFDVVCHLAAQAGVRYSLVNPRAFIDSNIVGFLNIIEACRLAGSRHLVYASSSSVYGLNESLPFSPRDNVDHPASLYAATKKANELMAHSYSHLYGLPTTGLRFFTVYGPWGRPDMALFTFTKSILEGSPIEVYNGGDMKRDFTYIGDTVEGVVRVLFTPPSGDPEWSGTKPDPSRSNAPYRIYNIGRGSPVGLMEFIGAIEKALSRKAKKKLLPLQPGDVPVTWADTADFEAEYDYRPGTPIDEGIRAFLEWYLKFYAH
jgi:UDP-glucuronate 4-epimerase